MLHISLKHCNALVKTSSFFINLACSLPISESGLELIGLYETECQSVKVSLRKISTYSKTLFKAFK